MSATQGRRRLLALGAAACWGGLPRGARAQASAAPAFSEDARRRLLGVSEQAEQARLALLEEAERQLAAGHGQPALDALERAALMRHTADTELRIVRAHMLLGQYRRALAFASHTAGAHRELSAGLALYGWLLHLGGQQVVATKLLADALARAPEDALLVHTRQQLMADWPQAGPLLRQQPWQAAPSAFSLDALDLPPAAAQVVGTATLLSQGHQALLALLADGAFSQRLWLRNGLGQTVAAVARRPLDAPGLQLLTLRAALPAPDWTAAPREPFAGAPGFMVEYAPDALGQAAWPLLRQGFFAGMPGQRAPRPLGIAAPPGPRGGPVFDAAGRLVGLGLAGPSAAVDRLFGLPLLRDLLPPDTVPEPAQAPDAPRRAGLDTSPDLAYEAGLRGALQVLVAR